MSNAQLTLNLCKWGYLPGVDPYGPSPSESVLQAAVARYQQQYAPDLNRMMVATRGREVRADGIIGPVTLGHMGARTCDFPDFPDSRGDWVIWDGGDEPRILSASRGYGFAGPCQKSIAVEVDFRGCPWGEGGGRELLERTFDRYSAAFGVGFRFVESGGNIRVSWTSLAGSTIGLAEFGQGCGSSVFCRFDPTYREGGGLVDNLTAHEFGHNLGLQHTRGGLMNPVNNQSFDGWDPRDPSFATMQRVYGLAENKPPQNDGWKTVHKSDNLWIQSRGAVSTGGDWGA
jgi:hypothetical protein